MDFENQIYTADSRALNVRSVVREMFYGLLRSRYPAYRIAWREIKSQYSQSALGIFWDFVDPLILGLVFYFLRNSNVFTTGETSMPYSIYIIFGLLLFQMFADATLQTTTIMTTSRQLLQHQKLYPEVMLLSVFFQVMFFSFFKIAVMLGFAFATGAFSLVGLLKFILLYPAIILAGLAIGTLLAPFNAIYRDVGRFVRMIILPARFLSPVLFVFPDTLFYRVLVLGNPFALILNNLRLLAVTNTVVDVLPMLVHCVVLLVIGLVGWFIFHLSVPIIADRA